MSDLKQLTLLQNAARAWNNEDEPGLDVAMEEIEIFLLARRTQPEATAPEMWTYDMSPPPGFVEYVSQNYKGDVIFHNPEWHAKRLWNAAMRNAKPPFVQVGATAPAQDLSAAILAIKLPDPQCYEYGGREPTAYSAKQMRDLLKAAAALASSANALSAGDRVDARNYKQDCEILLDIWDDGKNPYENRCYVSGALDQHFEEVRAAILQSQKGGSHG